MKISYFDQISGHTPLYTDADFKDLHRICLSLAVSRVLGFADTNRYFEDSCGYRGWIFFEDDLCHQLYLEWLDKFEKSNIEGGEDFKRLLVEINWEIIRKKLKNTKAFALDSGIKLDIFNKLVSIMPPSTLEHFTDEELTELGNLAVKLFTLGRSGDRSLLISPEPWNAVLWEIPKHLQERVTKKETDDLLTALLIAYDMGIAESIIRLHETIKSSSLTSEKIKELSSQHDKLLDEVWEFNEKLGKFGNLT